MIRAGAIAAAALFATPAGTQDLNSAAISITFGFEDEQVMATIDPGGGFVFDRPGGEGEPARVREAQELGPRGYPRIAAMLRPARRWVGSAIPCTAEATGFAGGASQRPIARIRWESDGKQAEIPVNCMRSPEQDALELALAAIDQMRDWAAEYSNGWGVVGNASDVLSNAAAIDVTGNVM